MNKSKNTKQWIIGGVILFVIIIGTILIFAPNKNETIKIGVSLPLTGEAASFGQGGLSGIETAVKEINEAGGINGRKLEVIIEDDQCTSEGGIRTFTKLVNIDQVDMIIGPACSAAAGSGIPVAEESKTPTIIWGSAPGLTQNNDYIFRTYPSDTFQGKFAAEYMINKLKKEKVAVIYVQNDWGQGIKDVFVSNFQKLGGSISFDEGIPQDAIDLKTILIKAKETNPDAIYFPVYPSIGIIGLKQMKELGFNVSVLGGDSFATDEIIKSGVAEGVMFTIGIIRNPDDFQQKVMAVSDNHIINAVTPLAYDAIKISARVIGEVGTDKEKIRNALASLSYQEAISLPSIEFDNEGDLKEAEFEVKVIRNNKAINQE